MDQSSRDDTLLGVGPSPGPGRGAVSLQSSRDKCRKRSLPGSTVRREGRAISVVAVLLGGGPPGSAPVTQCDSPKLWPRWACPFCDLSVVVAAPSLAHQLA
jgi:hypothetical protein